MDECFPLFYGAPLGLAMDRTPQKLRIILGIVVFVFVVRIAATYPVLSDVYDSPWHIAAGIDYLRSGDYDYEPQHPPLGRLAVAVLPYVVEDLELGSFDDVWSGDWLEKDVSFYWTTLTLARIGNLPFAVLLLLVCFLWTRDLFGPRAGVMAALLASCSPNLLAHAGVAALDIATAATFVAACYITWLWSRTPNWRYCLLAAVAVSAAFLTKFSTLGFLPPVFIGYMLLARGRDFRPKLKNKQTLTQFAAFAVTVMALCWAAYGLEYGNIARPDEGYWSGGSPPRPGSLKEGATAFLRDVQLPAPMLWRGLIDVVRHNRQGHRAYLLGEISPDGWWYYFPIVLMVKTSLPLLILAVIGAVQIRRGGLAADSRLFVLLLPVAVVLGTSMAASINIGVRHILPLYPFLAMLAAYPFRGSEPLFRPFRRVMTVFSLLLVWHVAESVAAHPDYLAYFNQIARGRETQVLADSNIDWGQDLARLAHFQQQQRLAGIFIAYTGYEHAAKFGINHGFLPPGHPQCCWVAAGLNQLKGILAPDMSHLADRRPAARIGGSVFIYKLRPEDVYSAQHSP